MRLTVDEWFVALLAGTIVDGEVAFHGFGSPCAQVAMHVAKRSHAPGMMLVEGAMYAVDPDPPFVPTTSNDRSLKTGAVYSMRFEEFFDAAVRGDVDRMFLSGGQIDAHGNTNLTAIGGLPSPRVKLGGGGGGCNLSATVGRLTLWSTSHRSGRTLVEACDFVTDLGHHTQAGSRGDLGYTGGGPEWLVTELGLFDFPEGRARLRARFPDVTLDDLRAATGFDVDTATEPPPLDPPSREVVALIRRLDPLGVRRREFRAAELERVFTT